jgi:hypothetical protein
MTLSFGNTVKLGNVIIIPALTTTVLYRTTIPGIHGNSLCSQRYIITFSFSLAFAHTHKNIHLRKYMYTTTYSAPYVQSAMDTMTYSRSSEHFVEWTCMFWTFVNSVSVVICDRIRGDVVVHSQTKLSLKEWPYNTTTVIIIGIIMTHRYQVSRLIIIFVYVIRNATDTPRVRTSRISIR